MELIILTGLSGSGKSTGLKTLEDLGFFTMDNIPFRFAGAILKDLKNTNKEKGVKKIALGLDIRTIINANDFNTFFNEIDNLNIDYKIIFLEASTQAILNRYNLTRRKHPLTKDTLLQSIEDEMFLMGDIKDKANLIIDTSFLNSKELSRKIEVAVTSFSKNILLNIHLQSFGFKHGVPIDADMIFDVRTLPNPYYIEELREKTGLDNDVYDYVMSFDSSQALYSKILDLILFLIPGYIKDEKRHLTIGIGCSGGKHRSVSFVRKLEKDLKNINEVNIYSVHRENERGNW
ncbi:MULTISPECIES: RNase adapter RapZ [Cetobacterium]|uniref:RNase adapter RapZ n=1 Tax=Candidatus Cetobacterium colombiensis TaxID=3073100 RepID=A0ABU4W9B4_9FUSO|nr:RNase adapter RapZ [Candidatus Cetobacterium colombiensis]MDX8335794.1 RNase adapter RapZ [Candidatus Cetobacterium colombiensis]